MVMRLSNYSPAKIIIYSMICTIIIGSMLLSCKWAQNISISMIDCIFVATSAACATGLMTIPIENFTPYGHAIIGILIQIGTIGLITLTIFFLSLFVNLGLSADLMTGEVFELPRMQRPKHIFFFIILFTIAIEGLGFIFIAYDLYDGTISSFLRSLFLSVSAFCNAGFIMHFNDGTSFFIQHPLSALITALLVLVGSVGFSVWNEIIDSIQSICTKSSQIRFSLHARIVFFLTLLLTIILSIIIFILEYDATSPFVFAFYSLFNGICLRSAGFTTLSLQIISPATIFAIMIVSFIGSSPGGCGGGIKTTTFAIFLAAIHATLSRRASVAIGGRTIPADQVIRAMAILCLSLCWIAFVIFLLLITENKYSFLSVASEAFAAFTNLGISQGLTPYLSSYGKILIIMSMFIGRIGSLTLLIAFKKQQIRSRFHYPEERILMG